MVVFYEYFVSEPEFIFQYVEQKCLEDGKDIVKGKLRPISKIIK